jgi:hypothetical protein
MIAAEVAPMKKYLLLILVLIALPAAATETWRQCLSNCRPGDQECTRCCDRQYDEAAAPCRKPCLATFDTCIKASRPKCDPDRTECLRRAYEGHDRTKDIAACEATFTKCYSEATAPCWTAMKACLEKCNPQIAGGCPGEVPPQKCPYKCQKWNSASKTCIGPRTNSCVAAKKSKSKTK